MCVCTVCLALNQSHKKSNNSNGFFFLFKKYYFCRAFFFLTALKSLYAFVRGSFQNKTDLEFEKCPILNTSPARPWFFFCSRTYALAMLTDAGAACNAKKMMLNDHSAGAHTTLAKVKQISWSLLAYAYTHTHTEQSRPLNGIQNNEYRLRSNLLSRACSLS